MAETEALPVSNLVESGALSINDGYRAKNDEFVSTGGLPFARVPNIVRGFDFAEADRLPATGSYGPKISEPLDVVITTKGTVGFVAHVGRTVERFVYSPQTSFWRVHDHSVIDPSFLAAWMNGPEFVRQALATQHSTDMAPYISLKDQRRMTISLPPIELQRAIGAILASIEQRAALCRREILTLEQIASSLFRSRFIEVDGTPSAIESGVQAWATESLADIAAFANGGAYTKHAVDGGSRMILRIADLNSGPSASTKYGDLQVPRQHTAMPGDLLFAWSGSLGVWIWSGPEAIVNQHIFNCIPRDGIPMWFLHQTLMRHLREFRAIAADKATTMGHIKREHLTQVEVAVPPEEVFAELDPVMTALYARVLNLQQQAASLASIRETLLPKLVSGELEVPDSLLEAYGDESALAAS